MHKNLPKKGKVTAAFMTILLVTTLIVSLLPKATATPSPVKIDSIDPTSGPVGITVRVIGEIDTTNGSYRILFDGEEIQNGTVVGTAVNDTFRVPPSIKGNHNVTLYDVTNGNQSLSVAFNVTTSYHVSAEPARIQEGFNTTITVGVNGAEANTTYTLTINVTDLTSAYYNSILGISTDTTGSGSNSTLYYGNFPAGANTNYVGTYTIAVNETLATGNFTVGLTNATEYYRFQVVNIRAANYTQLNECAWVNITCVETGETVSSENVSAVDGVIEANWTIPSNALLGVYTVTVTNSTTPGTIKPVLDIQNFTVIEKIIPISIYPASGSWGTTVRVEGEIVKPGGSYQIKWDNKTIKTGNCGSGLVVVNDTFIVPRSVKGYYNITLLDVNQTTESTDTFEVTTSCYVLAKPARILEGLPTTITVGVSDAEANVNYTFKINITDPLNRNWTINSLVRTNEDGSGENSTSYPGGFTGADTNYLGNYSITVNSTLATGSFTVGLTDDVEYRRTNKVIIQGSGYGNKTVTINITYAETGESVFSENVSAIDGIVAYFWTIPENATLGIYTVILTNVTGMQVKPEKPDIQNFTVIEIIIHLNTTNKYDKEPLAGVSVRVFSKETSITSGETNKTGLVDFRLDRGNYTFRAFWKDVQVGILENQSVTGNATEYMLQKMFNITCELAHIKIAINDEAGHPLPFINVTLANITLAPQTVVDSFETNYTGMVATNAFTNTSYTIEARRYGHLFNTTPIENLTVTRWINITCPTYTLFVHVLDSKGLPLRNVQVEVYEWSSERVTGPKTTDDLGSISLDCTFGRYKIKVYNYSAELKRTVVLNETVIDLIEDQFFFAIHCKISNLDLSVVVVDHFGQPIPNAKIKVEREFEEGYVNIANLTTGSDGTTFLPKIGGNYRISVYVMGKLCETKALHLDESKVIKFKIDRFVVVGGHPLEVTQLVACISLGILVALFGLALIYRRFRLRKVPEGKEKSL